MKYVVLLGDGMADDPQEELSGRTPLEEADTPNMDRIAGCGEMGLARTVPKGMEPGSDVANMSILGYEPAKYYTGRAAIEAAALGIELKPGEAAFRCNLVSLGGKNPGFTMDDYSGGHPTDEEQKAIIEALSIGLGSDKVRFVAGISFRNLCIISGFKGEPELAPPHDHAGEKVAELMPRGPGADVTSELIIKSQVILDRHPVNLRRRDQSRPPINSIWLWGMGRAASMPSFKDRHGLSGAVVTGVDLIRGLARLLDMEIVEVPGATGYVDTNFEGKARGVLDALNRVDFVFLHVEAPDEAGHEGDLALKIRAIEDFDKRTVGPILEGLEHSPDYRLLLLPDHETPVKERGHRGGPVPYAVVDSSKFVTPAPFPQKFCERDAAKANPDPLEAHRILETALFS